MNTLIKKVERWSQDRELHKSNSDKQLLKAQEEFGEVIQSYLKDQPEELKLELGDVLITLIIFAQQQDIDLNECLELAYNKISNRKGELVNGVYIKQEDLVK
ncbi:MAG TPA: MazG-like family protein [Pseudogracilibacillus sp.]|nr:MazG-like family protein [Pseudogracilibacillus sp.]